MKRISQRITLSKHAHRHRSKLNTHLADVAKDCIGWRMAEGDGALARGARPAVSGGSGRGRVR